MNTAEVVKRHVDRIRQNENFIHEWDEGQTGHYIVEPLLKDLGWDTNDPEAVYLLPDIAGAKKLDYLLYCDGKALCTVEVKKANDTGAEETLRRARALGTPWVLLTDGTRYSLYGVFDPERENKIAPVDEVIFSEIVDGDWSFLDYFTPESLGNAYEPYKRLSDRRALREFLEREQIFEKMRDWIEERWGHVDVELLKDAVRDILRERPKIEEPSAQHTQTTAKDWKQLDKRGVFAYHGDHLKKVDVNKPARVVEEKLKDYGLCVTNIWGFYYQLRERAGLVGKQKGRSGT